MKACVYLWLDISKQFGKKMKEIRLKKKKSQGDIAKILNVHRSYISGIERGIRNPSLRVIERITKALGVNIEEIVKK